jgi:hypothetical protein
MFLSRGTDFRHLSLLQINVSMVELVRVPGALCELDIEKAYDHVN